MKTYRLFKTIDNYKCEDYLQLVTNTRHRIALTKLQLSNQKLAKETGRYVSVKLKLQHPPPPPGIPRAFDNFAVPGRREFDYQSLRGVWGI